MKDIIPAIPRSDLRKELNESTFLRTTNKGNNLIFLVDALTAPQVLQEVGRLREMAFRTSGGGTGKALDLDQYDLGDIPYQQLVVWDPEDQEITAGYRLISCDQLPRNETGKIISATAHLFDYSERFAKKFLPYTIELGRSFVQPRYQRGAPRKGLFALDNLWDGLAAVLLQNPHLKYLFGKVTMYPEYNREARNLLLAFMHHFFPDQERLVTPTVPLISREQLRPIGQMYDGLDFKAGHQLLQRELRQRGEVIPPMINSYMNLSPSMKTFGTAENDNFGKVEETGILVTLEDIYPERKQRYFDSYADCKIYPGHTS